MRFVSKGMAAFVRQDAVGLWCFLHVLAIAATTALLVTNSRNQGMGWSLWILYYPLIVGGLQALFLRSLVPGSRKVTIVAAASLGLAVAVLVLPNLFYVLLYVFAVVPLFMSEQGTSPWFAVYVSVLALCSGALCGVLQWLVLRKSWAGAARLAPVHAILTFGMTVWMPVWNAVASMNSSVPATPPGVDVPLAAASGLVVAAVSGLALLQLDQRAVPVSPRAVTPAVGRRRKRR